MASNRSSGVNLRFKTSMLRSDLYDYSEAYIVAKGAIDILAAAANEKMIKLKKMLHLKMNFNHAFQKLTLH